MYTILSVSERTVRDWLSRIDKDTKDARNKRIFAMWMACYTQEEIAEREDLTHKGVGMILEEMADLPKLPKSDIANAEHATDFDPPLYNVWKQQEKTAGATVPLETPRKAAGARAALRRCWGAPDKGSAS